MDLGGGWSQAPCSSVMYLEERHCQTLQKTPFPINFSIPFKCVAFSLLNQGIRILLKAQEIFLFSVAFNRTHMCAQVHMFASVSRMEDNLECVSFSGVHQHWPLLAWNLTHHLDWWPGSPRELPLCFVFVTGVLEINLGS